jgi:myo-inositol-1-phosphate synthase
VAVAGVGNCASSLLQGLDHYRSVPADEHQAWGLMHLEMGGYRPEHVEVVAAFDVDRRKVGRRLHEAAFAPPNCTSAITSEIRESDVVVQMAPIFDGVAPHMADYPESQSFRPASEKPVDVASVLEETGAEILLSYLPVGSQKAVQHYAEACLATGVSLVNCVPVFVVSNPEWGERFRAAGIPCAGDDIKSQVGATIVHRMLARLFADRGVQIERTYQLK